MEIIRLDGYTEAEKVAIARTTGRPPARARALRSDEVVVTDAALAAIVADYTREAGVRNLEREVGRLLRSGHQAGGRRAHRTGDRRRRRCPRLARAPRFYFEAADRTSVPEWSPAWP